MARVVDVAADASLVAEIGLGSCDCAGRGLRRWEWLRRWDRLRRRHGLHSRAAASLKACEGHGGDSKRDGDPTLAHRVSEREDDPEHVNPASHLAATRVVPFHV